MVESLEAEFRCVNCGNKIEKNLMPWKHAILGIIPSLNRESSCCSNPSYEDLKGFHDAKSQSTLRQGASRALPEMNSLSFSKTKNQMNSIKMSLQQIGMINMQKAILLVSILMMVGMTSAASSDVPKASQTPGDTFYFLDKFSESLELTVAKAPVIGSSELEAKVRANHAAERLAEAQKLAENNKSEKVDSLMAEYSKQTNLSIRSAKKANNTNLSKRLGNVSNNHVEVLQEVQKKVPQQAQKGIKNAIENSQKNQKELGLPEKAKNRGSKSRTDRSNKANENRKPDATDASKSVNKTVGKTERRLNKSPIDEIQNNTPELEEQNNSGKVAETKEAADNITGSLDEQNPEYNKTNNTEDTVDDTASKITGEATGRPSTSSLP